MINWWNSLSLVSQIFYCFAIPSSLILLIQTIMMLMGIGDDADAFGDGADDLSDVEFSNEGVFGENSVTEAQDGFGLEGLRIFTLRGIVAFFVVFGWMGVVMDASGAKLWLTLVISAVCGFAIMLALAFLFRAILRLRSDGNTDNRNALGTSGKVQLTIPPSRSGEGKVHLMLQGSYVERNAVTDEEQAIPTGSEVIVIGISGQTDLVVKRK